jgi:hypothetical protein
MVNALMYFEKPTEKASLIGSAPLRGNFDLTDAKVIAPGDPFNSSFTIEWLNQDQGKCHIWAEPGGCQWTRYNFQWISSMPNNKAETVNSTDSVMNELKSILGGENLADFENQIEKLLTSSQGALGLVYAMDHDWLSSTQLMSVKKIYQNLDHTLTRDILGRWSDERPLNFGQIKLEDILALKPNLRNGSDCFLKTHLYNALPVIH